MIALYDLCILGELRLGMVAASHFLFQVTSTYLQKKQNTICQSYESLLVKLLKFKI